MKASNLLYAAILLAITGCIDMRITKIPDHSEQGTTNSVDDKTAAFAVLRPRQPANPSDSSTKTAVVAVVNSNSSIDTDFNHWESLKKTRGEVHLFASPDITEERLSALKAKKHQIGAANLLARMREVVSKTKAKQLIIFIDSVCGDAKARAWCFENPDQSVTDFDENLLLELLKVRNAHIAQVLIIPTVFHDTNPIMDKFVEKARKLKWPFDLVYVSSSVAGSHLMNNKLETPDEVKPADQHIKDLLKAKTLQGLFDIAGPSNYKIGSVTPHTPAINLDEFGFDLGLRHHLGNISSPYGKKIRDVLSNKLPVELFDYITMLEFDDHKNNTVIKVPVAHNLDQVLTDERLKK